MNTFGADSLTARLASIFNVAPKVRFIIAVYFGSVNIKTRVRYCNIIVDVICVVTYYLLLRGFFNELKRFQTWKDINDHEIQIKLFYSIKLSLTDTVRLFFDLKLEPIDSLLISFTIVSLIVERDTPLLTN
jgi:hypothetical protein